MQKRSHRLLASCLLQRGAGFRARRYELAFLFGSFQPDCNPLSYLKGFRTGSPFRGHNFSNSRPYIFSRIERLQQRSRWTVWQYYTLGKLTHYLADAFTYPHSGRFRESLLCHHRYERLLRRELILYLRSRPVRPVQRSENLAAELLKLHKRYLSGAGEPDWDILHITRAVALLMDSCPPPAPAF